MASIHPSAIVDSHANLADDCIIGPFVLIGPEVSIGSGTEVKSHAVITGKTTLGKNNVVYHHAVVGGLSQDKKYNNEVAELVIGDHNLIREYCTINTGVEKDGGITRVGNHNWIMAYVHLAHNVQVANHTVLVNNVQVAGHVSIGDYAVIGASSGVHQFCRIGDHVMVGAHSAVLKDIPPFVTAGGNPARAVSINITGLKRRGFDSAQIRLIREAFRIIYRRGLSLPDAIASLETLSDKDSQLIYHFLKASKRRIVALSARDKSSADGDEDES